MTIKRRAVHVMTAAAMATVALAGCAPDPGTPAPPVCRQFKLLGSQTTPSSFVWNGQYGSGANMTAHRGPSCSDPAQTAATVSGPTIAPPAPYPDWESVPGSELDFSALNDAPERQVALEQCAETFGIADRSGPVSLWSTDSMWGVQATSDPTSPIIGVLVTDYLPATSAAELPGDLWLCAVTTLAGAPLMP